MSGRCLVTETGGGGLAVARRVQSAKRGSRRIAGLAGLGLNRRPTSGASWWVGLTKTGDRLLELAHLADGLVYLVLSFLFFQRFLHESSRIINF